MATTTTTRAKKTRWHHRCPVSMALTTSTAAKAPVCRICLRAFERGDEPTGGDGTAPGA